MRPNMHKICVVSSTRADYGILKPLILSLLKEKNVQLQFLVTGSHLDKNYGFTIEEIHKDGIKADACIEIIHNDTELGILQTMSNALLQVGQKLKELSPDIVVLLGDRYEIHAIASACVILGIPIAHLYGGELSYGAFDEIFRHSITKMSTLHFTSCEEYKNRVIQLGEHPKRVFCVGSLSVENIQDLSLLSKKALDEEYGIDCARTLLATFHPVTNEVQSQEEQIINLLDALVEQDRYFTLFTKSNADTNASKLNALVEKYASKHSDKMIIVESLGIHKYMSMMKHCACVVGNSSSGILEAPSFKVPTLNIGNRQKGRIQAKSVIQCSGSKKEIAKVLQSLPKKDKLKDIVNPYEKKDTKQNIIKSLLDFLQNTSSQERIKEFYTL